MVVHGIIVEDSRVFLNSNRRIIKALAKKYDVILNLKNFSDTDEIMERYIEQNHIDVAFLDIEIGQGNKKGITAAKKIKKVHPLVALIFITSHGEFISKANNLNPVGFVDKPIDIKKMDELFLRVITGIAGQKNLEDSNSGNVICIKRNRQDLFIKESEVIYVKTFGRKIEVVTKKENILTNCTITNIAEKLSDLFVQISRDTIVNRREVIKVTKEKIEMSNNELLDIPVYKYASIVAKLKF